MRLRYFERLEPGRGQKRVGGKAVGLQSLMSMGLRVPRTHVCSAKAWQRYSKPGKGDRVIARLKRELRLIGLADTDGVAVRSSAAQEDSARHSMAGQLESFLNVRGVSEVAEAIVSVWKSAKDACDALPLGRASQPIEVLVQDMVHPIVSGAAFSRDPVSGAEQVIIEAVEGTSEALLQHGVTPRRWVIKREQPQSDWPLVPTEVLREITQTTRRVASELRYPADLEWAYDGEMLWWLQVRPITSLRGLPVYSNRISREYLPGLVKPLVWSINVPMINGAWIDLFESLVGSLSIDPLSLARQFHYRAYFNMSGMGALFRKLGLEEDTLEKLLGIMASDGRAAIGFRWRMILHMPRILRFMVSVLLFHRTSLSWVNQARATLDEKSSWLESARGMRELLDWSCDMLVLMRNAARYRIIALLIHMAVGQLGRRALKRRGVSDLSQLEIPDPDLDSLDPTIAIRRLAQAFASLPKAERCAATELPLESFLKRIASQSFGQDFDNFLACFGHLTESGNDFSGRPWSDDPAGVLQMVIAQAAAGAADSQGFDPTRPKNRANRWARRVTRRRVDRERIGAVFARGFFLLHNWALRLERVLQSEGIVDVEGDVFFLRLEELYDLAEGRLARRGARAKIARRKEEMAESASVSLPEQIIGDRVAEVDPFPRSANVYCGIGVSRGVYEGVICVVPTLEEAERFHDGQVLVVPYSDVAWTPLFARAGALIAEAGGILSHSAIMARELRIPAVVSVAGACNLPNGARVRVDGLEGRINVLDSA
jgi:phosphohistidine swiveling domain-containing protein